MGKSAIFFVLFICFFVVFVTDFHGPDEPVYFAYTASIVDDGDLNIVNNIGSENAYYYLPTGELGVSETYNLPDFHNHGGIVVWAPFYLYAKTIYFVANKFKLTYLTDYHYDSIIKCVMSFTTIIFGFLIVFLTFIISNNLFSAGAISLLAVLFMFLGTPLFYFTFYEIGNANVVACLFSVISIWFCFNCMNNTKRAYWLIYGVFLSVCMIIKIDLWFQIFFVFPLFGMLIKLNRVNPGNLFYFIIGFLPGIVLKSVNDYLKYGAFRVGEFGTFNIGGSYHFEQLFSTYRGFFYTSPILYLCLFGLICVIMNILNNGSRSKNNNSMRYFFILSLGIYLIVKIIIIGYRYAWGGGTVGPRPLLTEFPVFVLLFVSFLQNRSKLTGYFLCILSVIFVFWNWLIISEFIGGLDIKYIIRAPALSVRIAAIKHIYEIFYIKDIPLKLISCAPLVFAIGIILWLFKKTINSGKSMLLLCLLTLYLGSAYFIITILNVFNNRVNVEKLKRQDFFVNARIIKSRDFERVENAGSMDEMIEYFKLRGDYDRVNKIIEYKKKMYGE